MITASAIRGHLLVKPMSICFNFLIYTMPACALISKINYPIRKSVKEESALLEEFFTIMFRQFQGTGRQNVHIYA